METEVGVERNDEGKFESGIGKTNSPLSSTKEITNPVVYKLVRVDGDGRLVPATDDEVMRVEGLLADNNSEIHIVADTGQTLGCITNEGSSSGLPQLESLEGLLQSKYAEVNPHKLNAQLEEKIPSLAPSLSQIHTDPWGSIGECSSPLDKQMGGGSSTSANITTSKPDFSKLNGEICLDNLSIKELHETFKATFGRDTTVKDKQWLKRRIAMGLNNSCDVSTTTFVMEDGKVVKTGKEDICINTDSTFVEDPDIGATNGDWKDSRMNHGSLLGFQMVSDKRNHSIGDNSGSEDHNAEQRAAKRVRKPTRRYIEELSEVESKEPFAKLRISAKDSGLGQMSSRPDVRPVRNISSDGRKVITRLDSLGGSGIQVPRVSRVRRSRPRTNFMALLKFNPSAVGMAATLVKAIGTHNFPSDKDGENNVIKTRSATEQVQHEFIGVLEKDKQFSEVDMVGLKHNMELKHVDSSGNLDENQITVPTSKGGIRRKHHRAWTLSEVVKLVEGVSRYGAGRWSVIKRLAFASYSYRTSVDLKDKWRNLLKASFAQTPPDKGLSPRKNAASIPIPAPILSRVRMLAEMQAQVPPNLSSGKVVAAAGSTKKVVQETPSGYL